MHVIRTIIVDVVKTIKRTPLILVQSAKPIDGVAEMIWQASFVKLSVRTELKINTYFLGTH